MKKGRPSKRGTHPKKERETTQNNVGGGEGRKGEGEVRARERRCVPGGRLALERGGRTLYRRRTRGKLMVEPTPKESKRVS